MNLADEYRRQSRWRAWPAVFEALPPLQGCTVLDLGCAIGEQAARLAERGARVLGFDLDEGLLVEARHRRISGATFEALDLRRGPPISIAADGLWCSFTAAYFPDLTPVLERWKGALRPGAWLAFTEIDDLFAHEPLCHGSRVVLDRFAEEALAGGRYDFHMGRKLEGHLRSAGFEVTRTFTVPDAELAFDGAAEPEVVAAWRDRFARMPRLREIAGPGYSDLCDEFLGTLADPRHRCTARVWCVHAKRP